MQGTTPGAKIQRKPRMRWMDNMEEWTGMPFEDLLEKTDESGVDLFMKRPTLGSRMVEDKTRQDTSVSSRKLLRGASDTLTAATIILRRALLLS